MAQQDHETQQAHQDHVTRGQRRHGPHEHIRHQVEPTRSGVQLSLELHVGLEVEVRAEDARRDIQPHQNTEHLKAGSRGAERDGNACHETEPQEHDRGPLPRVLEVFEQQQLRRGTSASEKEQPQDEAAPPRGQAVVRSFARGQGSVSAVRDRLELHERTGS